MDINDRMDVGHLFKGGRTHKEVVIYPYQERTEFQSQTPYIGAM
jgi:hypothetical protein